MTDTPDHADDPRVSLDDLFTPTKLPRTWWSPTAGLVQDVPTELYVHVASGEPMISVPDDAVELRPLTPAAPGHAAPGESATWPTVRGRCPNCAGSTLMLGDGGHVTCSASDCDDPGMADDLLRFAQRWGSRVRSVRLVAQLGGLGDGEVVGGAPRGVEPASQVLVPRLVPGECLTEGCALVDQAHTYAECTTTAPTPRGDGGTERADGGEAVTDDERLRDRIDAVLNPSDDDADEASIYAAAVERIAAYVASQPCTCTPAAADPLWLADPCERCSVLGRRADQPEDR